MGYGEGSQKLRLIEEIMFLIVPSLGLGGHTSGKVSLILLRSFI